jgi:hypothetical protein
MKIKIKKKNNPKTIWNKLNFQIKILNKINSPIRARIILIILIFQIEKIPIKMMEVRIIEIMEIKWTPIIKEITTIIKWIQIIQIIIKEIMEEIIQ